MSDNKNKGSGSGRRVSGEDHRLWEFVTRTITPLPDRQRNTPVPPETAPQPRKARFWRAESPDIRLKEAESSLPGDKNTEKSIDSRTAGRFRQGKMPIEATLDLHGLRQAGAQNEFFSFLQESSFLGRRCVLVITGKGFRGSAGEAGVLRRMLPLWLEMEPIADLVLTFSPARPKDGGDGAFYILLRRQRPNP